MGLIESLRQLAPWWGVCGEAANEIERLHMSILHPEQYAEPTMEFKVIGNTNASNPGNGCMRFNTGAQVDATQLYFCNLAAGNVDVSAILSAIVPGDKLNFQGKNDNSVIGSFSVTSVTNNSGWFTVDVAPVSSSGAWPIPGNTAAIITVQVSAVEQPPADAPRYEYLMDSFPAGTLFDKQSWLNQLGADGWQFVHAGGLSADGTAIVIFMRQLG